MPTNAPDLVNHPPHYADVVPGVECIELSSQLPFCRGNALKYVWRAGVKTPAVKQDYAKAEWYMKRAIEDNNKASPQAMLDFHQRTIGSTITGPKITDMRQYLEAETNRVRRGLVLMITSPSVLMWEACVKELQELQKL